MPASTPTSTRPYVSRKKRRSSSQDTSSFSSKFTFGVIGLLLLGLLVSLGVIATSFISPAPTDMADNVGVAAPASTVLGK